MVNTKLVEMVPCPECLGANNYTEVQCSLCDGLKEVSDQTAVEYLERQQVSLEGGIKKGTIVTVQQFSDLRYTRPDSDQLYHLPVGDQGRKIIHSFNNVAQKTPYMIVGYVYVTIGNWTKTEGRVRMLASGFQRIKLYKVTPLNNGLAQQFCVFLSHCKGV